MSRQTFMPRISETFFAKKNATYPCAAGLKVTYSRFGRALFDMNEISESSRDHGIVEFRARGFTQESFTVQRMKFFPLTFFGYASLRNPFNENKRAARSAGVPLHECNKAANTVDGCLSTRTSFPKPKEVHEKGQCQILTRT